VQTAASHIRINVRLIDLARGTHVWTERYDVGTGNLLDLQDHVVGVAPISSSSGCDRAAADWIEIIDPIARRGPGSSAIPACTRAPAFMPGVVRAGTAG
jgi:hypothetical protein